MMVATTKHSLPTTWTFNIIPQIKRIEGVGDVMMLGDAYSMRIWLKPDRMAQYGLVPSDVTAVLGEQNLEAPTGQLGENSQKRIPIHDEIPRTPKKMSTNLRRSSSDHKMMDQSYG